MKSCLARDLAANPLLYNFDSDLRALYGPAALNDATNSNLQPFPGAGGKLNLWHGGNDSARTVKASVDHHAQVVAAMDVNSASSFARAAP